MARAAAPIFPGSLGSTSMNDMLSFQVSIVPVTPKSLAGNEKLYQIYSSEEAC
jgi:hypothetical protein